MALLALLVVCPLTSAKTRIELDSDMIVDHWSVKDGIPGSQVLAVAQTGDGYIWAGTYYGLTRFDGIKFTNFDSHTPGIPNGSCYRLMAGPAGTLWCLFGKSIAFYENGVFRTICTLDRNRYSQIIFKAVSQRNQLYAVGVTHVDRSSELLEVNLDGSVQRIRLPEVKPPSSLKFEIAWTSEDERLIRIGDQIRIVENGEFTELESLPHLTPPVRGPSPSRRGGNWISQANRIQRWKNGQWEGPAIELPDRDRIINRLIEAPNGNLWVLVDQGHVDIYQEQNNENQFSLIRSFKTSQRSSVTIDHEGHLWFGRRHNPIGDQSGLYRVHERAFRHSLNIASLPPTVRAFVQPVETHVVLIGSATHEVSSDLLLDKLETGAVTRKLFGGQSWSGFASSNDELWVSKFSLNLAQKAKGLHPILKLSGIASGEPVATMLPTDPQLGGSPVIITDQNGDIWTTEHGNKLLHIKDGIVTEIKHQDFPAGAGVLSLAYDSKNNLWIGTKRAGLIKYSGGKFTYFARNLDALRFGVRAIFIDQEETLWLGTSGHGLVRFKEGQFQKFTTADGFPANEINTVVDDELGYLWVGSYNGIHRVSKEQLDRFAAGGSNTLSARSFGLDDGLSTLQCSSGHPASLRAHDGRLWFATVNGVNIVDPKNLPGPSSPPKVILESILLDGAPYSLQNPESNRFRNGDFTFSSRVKRIEFQYTAISFDAPNQIRFRYQLEPLISGWQEAAYDRTIILPQLKPGRYQFSVTAANTEGVWSEHAKSLTLHVTGQWWQRTPIQVLLGLSGLALIFAVVSLRSRQMRRRQEIQEQFTRDLIEHQEADRKRIAQELHDSLEQNLLVIKNQATLPTTNQPDTQSEREVLKEISAISAASIEEVRSIANNLRPYQIDRLGLTKAIQAMLNQIAQAAPLTIDHEIESVPDDIPAEARINLYRIIQEALNNTLKHAQASHVTVTLIVTDRGLSLRIKDNGVGFDPSQVGKEGRQGFGISGIMERAAMIGATYELKSSPGFGAEWTVRLQRS